MIFGKAAGFATIDLTGLAPADGFIIQGDARRRTRPASASPSAGDVNGDGFDDLIVGAPHGDDGGINAGEAYVIFGKASGFATIDLAALTQADGFIIQGEAANDLAGGASRQRATSMATDSTTSSLARPITTMAARTPAMPM